MSNLYSVEGDKLKLSFHEGQSRAWDSEARFTFVIAGSQGGKTSFGPFWLWREIQRRGQGDYLAVTSTYDLFKLKMLPEIRYIFEDVLGIARYYAGEKILELKDPTTGKFWASRADDPMWGRVILRSAVAKGGLESSTAKGAWLDECGQPEFTIDTWEAVRRRLTLNTGRVLGTTTPYDLGWLKTAIVDKWERGDPTINVVQFPSIFNPSFPKEEFESLRKSMPSWKFRMMFMGEFTHPAGMIFSDFRFVSRDHGGHIVKPFTIPPDWPVYLGIDPGSINTGKIWIAKEPVTNTCYVFHETLDGTKTTKQHVQEVLQFIGEKQLDFRGAYIGNKAELQQRLDYRSAGLIRTYSPSTFDVESGLDRILMAIKEDRLFVFSTCENLLGEMREYSRQVNAVGDPIPTIKNKSQYHHIDALRYASEAFVSTQGILFA